MPRERAIWAYHHAPTVWWWPDTGQVTVATTASKAALLAQLTAEKLRRAD